MEMIPDNISTVLLDGRKSQLKDILFKYAMCYAERGLNIWFISPQRFNQLPENLKLPDKEVLKLITFLYLKDQKDLLTHLNGVHLWHKYPQLIILDEFEHYCLMCTKEYTLSNAAFVTASLLDATSACAYKHLSKKASLLVSCEITEAEKVHTQLNTLTDMYFPNVLKCHGKSITDLVIEIEKYLHSS